MIAGTAVKELPRIPSSGFLSPKSTVKMCFTSNFSFATVALEVTVPT